MTDKPSPFGPQASDAQTEPSNLPVPSGPRMEHDVLSSVRGRKRAHTKPQDALFATQVLGGGEKRGLKGGPDTLEAAKSTYLRSEYSGANDRRPKPGRITKTEI